MKLTKLLSIVFMSFLMISTSLSASAQSTTGRIYGTVADPSGAAVPGATVVIMDVHTNLQQTANTNGAGEYVFTSVNPSDYTVTSSAKGFKNETQSGVILAANQNVHVDFALPVGNVSESVEVQAGITLVDTREAQLGETIDQDKIENLPTLNRDVLSLVTITPGVTNYSADIQIGSRIGATFSANGLQTDMESFYLDGAYNDVFKQNGGNKMPNPDALQEFRILSSNFDAEFGRAPAAVVNAITKSGTDRFHGTVYDYFRNNILNARNYFVSATDPTPKFQQNQFGVTLGGPVKLIPKTFFFTSYQGLVLRSTDIINAGAIQTLTAAERTGDFSQDAATKVFGTGGTFQVPKLPAGANCGTAAAPVICNGNNYNKALSGTLGSAKNFLDPVAQAALAYMPLGSNPTSGSFNHTSGQQAAPANSSVNEGLIRLDYNGLANHQIEAMFYTSRGTAVDNALGGNQTLSYVAMNDYDNQDNGVLGDIWTISPKSASNFRAFYTQNRYILSNVYTNHFIQNLGGLMAPGGRSYAPSRFNLQGYVSMSNGGIGPSDILQQQFGAMETVNLVRGNHDIKLGGSYVWTHYIENGANAAGGNFTFTGSVTSNTFADFLLGQANNLNQSNSTYHHSHQYDPAIFAQDDWQITKRLNLNLGARWEVFSPYTGDPGLGTFAPYVQSTVLPAAPLGLLYQGDPGVPRGVFNTSYFDFAPRIGFALDARGDGRTSIRGGFGVFFFQISLTGATALQPPYALNVSTAKTPSLVCPYGIVTNGTCTGDPYPYDPTHPLFQNPAAGTTVQALPSDGGSTPYVYEYNLTLEHQLSPKVAFHMAYVGNGTRKNYINLDANAPVYAPNASTTAAGIIARRPYEPSVNTFRFGTISLDAPVLNGSYNSVQTTLRAHFSRRTNVFASYVWAKALNYGGAVVDNTDIRKNYGVDDSDIRHRFVVSYLYLLPETRRFGWFGKQVLDGWQLNGVTALQSGNPFTIISGTDTNLDSTTNDRVNVIGNPYPTGQHLSRALKIKGYINPAAFSTPCNNLPSCNPYGNEQKNQFFGPANVNTNLGLFKEFPIYEAIRFQFRAESFNVFGNVNLGSPKTNLNNLQTAYTSTDPTQGEINSAGAPRRIQFAAKILF
jgi:hypothetical protein